MEEVKEVTEDPVDEEEAEAYHTTPSWCLVPSTHEVFVLRKPGAMFGQSVVQHLAGFWPKI